MNPFDEISRKNPEWIDELYRQYLNDPTSVDEKWRWIFSGYDFALKRGTAVPESGVRPEAVKAGTEPRLVGVYDLVHTYRELGHATADLDPLGGSQRRHPLLELSEFGFTEADMDTTFEGGAFAGIERATLRELVEALKETYCHTTGVEFLGIRDKEQREWLQQRMEPWRNHPELYDDQRKALLKRVLQAESFEQFIHTKYVGAKRFSLEGGEALIPLLDDMITTAAAQGAKEMVIGMPHRGRLNVLTHILRKPYATMLAEFEGIFFPADVLGAGDVKYHLGYSHDHTTERGDDIHLSLCYNPSHLEIINPVVEGIVRAKQDVAGDEARKRVVPVLLHGDAAFAGQGVVYETLMFSDIAGYSTGGTIHVIVNNQVGFTTDPDEGRSTYYASAVAKVIQAPIFHVNADDPEAVVHAGRMAAAYRQAFGKDVVIDLICYRRHGHNELDDPTFTQPQQYAAIKAHPTVTEIYSQRLKDNGVLGDDDIDAMKQDLRSVLDDAHEAAQNNFPQQKAQAFGGLWDGLSPYADDWGAETRISKKTVQTIAGALTRIPEGFTPHKRMPKMLEQLAEIYEQGDALNWAAGELLAYGALLLEGIPVRLSGQDSKRGTFSHRHAVWRDAETGDSYVPLNHIDDDQAQIEILNSPLNEVGVLGFDYGYSSVDPNRLVLWEAQFGDFANGAQVVIDQFIASGESKWRRGSGLVMLLPHGYEGQGPEHSSARPERFLQLCAEDNMQVANCTTPAQIFHLLRRQVKRNFRKPLVVMTPKSLLRHPKAVSALAEFTERDFLEVIDDPEVESPGNIKRVLLCTGKVYYSLHAAREENEHTDVAIVRVEQLYPFPSEALVEILEHYENANDVCWVQEEPWNQGAWQFVLPRVSLVLGPQRRFRYIGRPESASPATGNHKVHSTEESEFLRLAFADAEARPRRQKRSKESL